MTDHISVSRSGGVCEVRLSRPEKRNALTAAMYGALSEALRNADADDAVRAVLLSGAGANFSAGNDLNDFLSALQGNVEPSAVGFLRTLAAFRKVLIAAVHGQTVGIGVTLLLHCDLVLAARSTQLSLPFVKLGLVPEAASSLLLPRLIGHQRAAELLFLGKPFDAASAFTLGIVNRVTEDETLMDEARALARAVAEQPVGALLATKRLLRSETASIPARIEEELRAFRAQLESAEFRRAAQAFIRK